jgi:hypothetical protein
VLELIRNVEPLVVARCMCTSLFSNNQLEEEMSSVPLFGFLARWFQWMQKSHLGVD